jgi:hypothetical protein
MKLGLIVESTRQGMEWLVFPRILQLLGDECGVEIECDVVPMTNKKLLILDGPAAARVLLGKGCDRVMIVWDENPPWTPAKDFAKQRCWHIEREQILAKLKAAKIERAGRIRLVCIEREFETWLLHDDQLLSNLVSTSHRAKIKSLADPLRIDDPKATLKGLFQKNRTSYNADLAARKCANVLDGLTRLRRCDTFRYFAQCVLGKMPKGWKPYVYHPKGPKRAAADVDDG